MIFTFTSNEKTCRGCSWKADTEQGLAGHYSQKSECLQKMLALRLNDTLQAGLDEDLGGDDDDGEAERPVNDRPAKRSRVVVEDAMDEDEEEPEMGKGYREGDVHIDVHRHGGGTFGTGESEFDKRKAAQKESKEPACAPFRDYDEYEWYEWLTNAVSSLGEIDKGLKLNIVKERINPSFGDKKTLLDAIDELPAGPEFTRRTISVRGNLVDENGNHVVEEVEFYTRDPVACVKELFENPALKNHTVYKPRRVFRKRGRKMVREYNEMWTGRWWWKMQDTLPDKDATIVPIILASDKTKLSYFSGDKAAWPVYITLGNIAKGVRREVSKRATVLLGYLPVTKLASCMDLSTKTAKKKAALKLRDIFHLAMTQALSPLIEAGTVGVEMICPDGFIRRVYPILAAYLADFPEQCLVACNQESGCPTCDVRHDRRGEPFHSNLRDQEETFQTILAFIEGRPGAKEKFEQLNLRNVYPPFWSPLPHTNIHNCFTPDKLHQLHKGIFWDHLFKWCSTLLGADELDRRFKAMPNHPLVRHFRNGVTSVSQWTGKEFREMEKVFLGVIAGAPKINANVMASARALLDFIYIANYHSLTTLDLQEMDAALATFHSHKQGFAEIRTTFDIPKFHSLVHYTAKIKDFGSLDGYNTELPERLHIDLAKSGYRASNKNNYTPQMVNWLARKERMWKLEAYIRWRDPTALEPERDDNHINYYTQPEAAQCEDNADDDADDDADVDADGGVSDVEEEREEPTDRRADQTSGTCLSSPVFTVAKQSPFPSLSPSVLHDAFGAVDFLPALQIFLKSHLLPNQFRKPSKWDNFLVFKKASRLVTPSDQRAAPFTDRVRAVPAKGGLLPAAVNALARQAAYFDTVLAKPSPNGPGQVMRVRAIFKLPDVIAPGFGVPLIYAETFTSHAKSTPVKGINMYKVQRERLPGGKANGIVIRLDWVLRSCFLLPDFGKAVPKGWRSSTILDVCDSFFLNDTLDPDSYDNL